MGRLPPPSLFNVVKKINREGGIFDFMLQKGGGGGGWNFLPEINKRGHLRVCNPTILLTLLFTVCTTM